MADCYWHGYSGGPGPCPSCERERPVVTWATCCGCGMRIRSDDDEHFTKTCRGRPRLPEEKR